MGRPKGTGREPQVGDHPDDGCELATAYLQRPSSCLDCPFPKCKDESPHFYKKIRDGLLANLNRKGKTVEELANQFSISEKTVKRAIKDLPEGEGE